MYSFGAYRESCKGRLMEDHVPFLLITFFYRSFSRENLQEEEKKENDRSHIKYVYILLNCCFYCLKKKIVYLSNFYGWDEKTYWKSIHGQSSAVGESGIVREIKEFYVVCEIV